MTIFNVGCTWFVQPETTRPTFELIVNWEGFNANQELSEFVETVFECTGGDPENTRDENSYWHMVGSFLNLKSDNLGIDNSNFDSLGLYPTMEGCRHCDEFPHEEGLYQAPW